jgi:hypothetical protein
MYAKVPNHLREPLLKELRQQRLRSAFKYYPALVLIFSSIAALAVFVEGHAIVWLIRGIVPSTASDGLLISIALAMIFLTTAGALIFFLKKEYKECDCQECLYCPQCDAVDKYDSGECPICHRRLQGKDSFYFTTYKDEQKIIERWGLRAAREE